MNGDMDKQKTAKKSEYLGPRRLQCPKCGLESGTGVKLCPSCNYVFGGKDRRDCLVGESTGRSRSPGLQKRVQRNDESQFVKELVARGFKFVRHMDSLTGEIVKSEDDPKIEALGLRFSTIPLITEDVHVIQTSPQVQVAMPLDKFLELTGIKP